MTGKRILFVGMKPKKSVSRYVEREVEKWISQEQSALISGRAEYFVEVAREEAFPFYQCSVEVGFGPYQMRSNEGGKTLEAALSNSLRRMRVVAPSGIRVKNRVPAVCGPNVA